MKHHEIFGSETGPAQLGAASSFRREEISLPGQENAFLNALLIPQLEKPLAHTKILKDRNMMAFK